MRALARIGTVYLLLVIVGVLWRVLPFDVVAPQVPFAFAAYAALVASESLPQAMFSVVASGYLADLLGGGPRGMLALVCGWVFLLARAISSRVLVRGRGFTFFFCLAMTTVGLVSILAVRSYLGVAAVAFWAQTKIVLGDALVTALLAPLLFSVFRATDARFARTRRERETLRQGHLS